MPRAGDPGSPAPSRPPATVEVSVVIPCLNEAETIGSCVSMALDALAAAGTSGEVIVADNASTDDSRSIAEARGARVVTVPERGYGSALLGGIDAARGRYVVIGDADASYDFGEIGRFLERLRAGAELVQGCRLPAGGGRILPGAMPWLHRAVGNPLFTALARSWFGVPIHDIHCGLRAFERGLPRRLGQRCTGMEFASEMIIKATLTGVAIDEVPITLHPDGRSAHPPHLRPFRDGWRHLRFFLLYSPRWLFLAPGALLVLIGVCGYAIAMPRATWGGIVFDVHTLLFSSLAIVAGYQSILFAVFTSLFAISEKLLPPDARLERWFGRVTLEKGLVAGGTATVAGLVLLGVVVREWWLASFGPLDYVRTLRSVIPGVTLSMLGFQTILSSFFLSILGLKRR